MRQRKNLTRHSGPYMTVRATRCHYWREASPRRVLRDSWPSKISMLARSGTVRMPVVYGVMTHEEHPGPDVLLIERLRGVPVEAPARTPERWEQLKDQIVEGLLAPASAGQSRLRRNGR